MFIQNWNRCLRSSRLLSFQSASSVKAQIPARPPHLIQSLPALSTRGQWCFTIERRHLLRTSVASYITAFSTPRSHFLPQRLKTDRWAQNKKCPRRDKERKNLHGKKKNLTDASHGSDVGRRGGARSKPVRPLLPLSSRSVQGRSSSCLLLLTRPAALSHPGGEVEGAQPLGQGRLQLLQGPIPPAVSQRGDVARLSGPRGSQQQAPEVLSLQQRWHVLQEVTLAEGAQLRRAVGLREREREGGGVVFKNTCLDWRKILSCDYVIWYIFLPIIHIFQVPGTLIWFKRWTFASSEGLHWDDCVMRNLLPPGLVFVSTGMLFWT